MYAFYLRGIDPETYRRQRASDVESVLMIEEAYGERKRRREELDRIKNQLGG